MIVRRALDVGLPIDDREPAELLRQIECGDCRTVVGRSARVIGPRIRNGDRHGERRVRPVDVDSSVLIPLSAIDVAGADAEVWHHFALEEGRELIGVGIPEVRIERLGGGAAALVHQRAALARLPAIVVVEIGPPVALPPRRRIRLDVEHEVGAGVPVILPVVGLQHRLAVAAQVVGHANARHRQVPRDVVIDGRERLRGGVEFAHRVSLLWRERPVAIDARAQVERQLAIDAPDVMNEGAVGHQAADRVTGLEEDDVEFRAGCGHRVRQRIRTVLRDMHEVLFETVDEEVLHRFVEDFAANLDVVIAGPVLEQAQRAEDLIAAPFARPIAVAAVDIVIAGVLVAEARAVDTVVPVISVLAAADLGKRVVADHAVPLGLVHPRPEVLVPRRRFGEIETGVDGEQP